MSYYGITQTPEFMKKNMSLGKSILIILSLCGILCPLRATSLQFRHIGEKEGLKYTWVHHITGDSRGYIWFSTMYGAFRYDGFGFREYAFRSDEGKVLRVLKVFEDSRSNLWFCTDGGLFRLNPHDGSQSRFSLTLEAPFRIGSNLVEDICEDDDGNLWIAGGSGVDCLGINGTRAYYGLGRTKCLMLDSRGNVWAAVGDRVLTLDRESGDFVQVGLQSVSGMINDIYQDSSNDIWIASRNGLVCYRQQSKQTRSYSVASGELRNNLVRQVIQDRNGDIWAATEGGIVRITGGRAELVMAEGGNPWGLNDNAVYSLYCDSDDNLWVGTFFGGVNVRYNHFRMFDFMLTSSSSFSASSKVLSGIVHTGGRLYAGTENDGLYILGPEGNNVHCPAGKDGLKSGNIHSVCLDRRGNLWLGTYLGGLYMRPKGRSSFISFRSGSRRAPELTTNNVYSILNDSMGNLWVGTRDGGLYRYDYETGTLVHVAGNLPNNLFIWDIFEDSVGDIWLACYGAHIWKLSSSEGYAAHEVESPVSTYVSICELSDGRIAFCTETDGIICFNPRDNSCAKVTFSFGLPDDTVYAALQDDYGNLWFSTNSGLCRTDLNFSSYTRYTICDGLPTNRFNYNSAEKHDGKLYFGSTNGLVEVDPCREIRMDVNRPIRFNDLWINNIRQSIGPDGPLPSDINELDVLRLEHWQNTFSIDFSNNMFGYNYGQTFAYKMKGLDDDWHVLDASNRVDFMGLKPGNYCLSVANMSEGHVMDNISSLKIMVRPVWWQSTAARICLAILLLALATWLLVMFVMSSKHRHELEIERLNREKDKEIADMKFRFFDNISHEFKTPLSLILGPVEQFMNGIVPEGKMDRYFEIIKKNADKLLALINELLGFRELQSATLSLSSFDVLNSVTNVMGRYEWQLEDKGIMASIDVPESLVVEADLEKFETILDNLLSNACKHCSKGDNVCIRAEKDGEMLRLTVRDTGEGISPDKLEHIFDRFFTVKSYDMYSSGVGLSHVKSLVELHGGRVFAASKVGELTEIGFEIPLHSDSRGDVQNPECETVSMDMEYASDDRMHSLEKYFVETDLDNGEYLKIASETVILIVEDDSSMKDLLFDYFSRKYIVIGVDNGEAASRLVREGRVDIVISDVMLDGMSGYDLCRSIKSSIDTSHIKVILMTVLSEYDQKCRGYLAGADSWIVKPFSFSLLELMVRNIIVGSWISRENYRKFEIDLSKVEIPASNADEQLLNRISSAVMDSISDSEFNVDTLCLRIGMSKASLYRKLKALTGQSGNEFIQNVRLKYAARLLIDSDRLVSAVAYDCGFSDPYYFSRAFRKLFGMSPKQWRQQHHEGTDTEINRSTDAEACPENETPGI